MSLIDRIKLAIEDIRDKFNLVTPRLIPTGGNAGSILVKKTATDNDVEWQEQNAQTYIQDEQPVSDKPFFWIQTNIGGNPDLFTIWFEDGQ